MLKNLLWIIFLSTGFLTQAARNCQQQDASSDSSDTESQDPEIRNLSQLSSNLHQMLNVVQQRIADRVGDAENLIALNQTVLENLPINNPFYDETRQRLIQVLHNGRQQIIGVMQELRAEQDRDLLSQNEQTASMTTLSCDQSLENAEEEEVCSRISEDGSDASRSESSSSEDKDVQEQSVASLSPKGEESLSEGSEKDVLRKKVKKEED